MTAAIAITAILQHQSFTDKIPGFLPEWKMVAVPDGRITIAGVTHEVKGIWIGETEVSWDLFDVWTLRQDHTPEQRAKDHDAENRPSRPYGAPDRGFGHSGYAALSMTYQSAVKFCEWLSAKTGRKYRLPTEAEWEYCARAGASSLPSPLGDFAWHGENSDSVAHKVRSKKPNALGLYDTLGNVAEWCKPLRTGPGATIFGSGPRGGAAVSIPAAGTEPVVRGGHFYTPPAELSFSLREPYDPSWQLRDSQIPKSAWWLSDGEFVGMRLVCER